ncbi:MAG: hypothetical protein Q7T55_13980, partial [Solirubrobacteraceae bacterium]|nr:hypothetical protein [Solirubrobacteraceae bacterium]
ADDRTLTVGWNGGVPQPEPLVLEEASDRVLVTASELMPVGAMAAVAARSTATATLNRPLAGRTIIDATTGNAVARGRAADWPDEEPEFEPAG